MRMNIYAQSRSHCAEEEVQTHKYLYQAARRAISSQKLLYAVNSLARNCLIRFLY